MENGDISLVDVTAKERPTVNFSIREDNNLTSSTEDNKVTYANTANDYLIVYQSFKDYLKEEIVLNSENSQREFEFVINQEFDLVQSDEGGIRVEKDEKLLYYIYPLTAEDKNAKKINYKYVIKDNVIRIQPTTINEFTNVEYPIVIDPTVSWVFSSTQEYLVSDPSKVEVVNGVARLVNNAGSYATDNPFVISKNGSIYETLSGFSEELGVNNQGSVQYQISNVSTSWYGTSWLYRKKINLTGISANQTDYQAKIVIDTASLISAGKLQSACQDIRFTDANSSALPYWIETGTNGCNTATTTIWVKVPSVLTTGTSIYVYYGNSIAANTQNGSNVFLFFDDFSSGSMDLNKWGWSTAASASITNGELTITNGAAYSKSTINTTNQNTIFEMRAKWAATATQYSGLAISNATSIVSGNANRNKLAMLISNATTNISQRAFAASGVPASYDVANDALQFTPVANTYTIAGFSYDTTTLRYYQDRTVTNSYASTASYSPYMFMGYFMGASSPSAVNITDVTVDFVLARKMVLTEPSINLESEEVVTTGTWYWWNGSAWVLTTGGYENSNSATEINTHISNFATAIGTGTFKFKAFLHAGNSNQQVELDSVSIIYSSSTAPIINSLSATTGPSIGETDITIYGSNFNTGGATRTFSYTGADQTYTVPAGVYNIKVKMWGGGGGGGHKGTWTYGYEGGGGGYTEVDMNVTPGQVLTVMVGAGGTAGNIANTSYNYGGGGPNCTGTDCQYGGQGGGRSAIRVAGEDVATAGGGGGGGSTSGNNMMEYGGGGGGAVGEDGVSPASNAYAGKGGTQSAGGAAGSGANSSSTGGQKYLGGRANTASYGGSGGGGWYGGGAGAYTSPYMGGGGGGSGYIDGFGVVSGVTVAAVNRTQARSYDLDNGGAGLGGYVSSAGVAGKVIIETMPRMVTVGGIAARNIRVTDSNTIVATIPGHLPGTYEVEVTNPDGQKTQLLNAYTYVGPEVISLSKSSGTSMGGEDITITGVNFDDSVKTTTYTYTGADQTYTVPEGVTSVKVKMWGAGGGGGHKGSWTYGYPGGAGGYTEADVAVQPGQNLIVVVGQGGNSGLVGNSNYTYGGGGPNCGGNDCQYGGQGGGRSAIKLGTEDILTAGGGGGGGSTQNGINDESGGGGGGLTGQDGTSPSSNAYAGKGGTQSAGGAAGSGSSTGSSPGQKYLGGRPNSPTSYGGSGGGGYYGGGAGAFTGTYMGGGGGGSSYYASSGISNPVVLAGKGSHQPKAFDVENQGAGAGGLPSTAGQNGRVIITATQAMVKFGNVNATNVRFTNSTTIVATTPRGVAGLTDITVINGDGQSDTLEDSFTFIGPTITTVSPSTGSTSGGDTVTISGTDFSNSITKNVFPFASADQYYVVPDGVNSIYVKMWGAGGGGGAPGSWGYGYPGGGGGYTESFVQVNPGDVITIMAGSGGNSGTSKTKFSVYGGGGLNCIGADATSTNCIYGGQGGGRSAIRINGQEILTAGAGGGGGSSRSAVHRQNGGAGGGLVGQRGLSEDLPYYGGNGGTQNAGGVAYTGGGSGSQYTGGSHVSASTFAGTGGGGWYGGSTGAYAEPNTMGGGGGGSSYIGAPSLVNPIALQGKFNVQAKSTDFENSSAGAGGAANTAGQPGKVIIYALPLKVSFGGQLATEVQYINSTTISVKTPEYAAGTVDVSVVNPDGETYTLPSAYTYSSLSVDSVTPTTGTTTGGTTITISGSKFSTPKVTTFNFAGVEETYTVPAGVTSIRVKMWGAGGGGGNAGGWTMGHPGGGGGYTEADLAVTPGQVLNILVGAGGHSGNIGVGGASYGGGGASCVNTDCRYGGQGGGRSAIRIGSEDILTAGGGGAGGSTSNNTYDQTGGAGGGLVGENGYSAVNVLNYGMGGGQTAGGGGGIGTGSTGTTGTKYTGGATNTNSYGGGGGGGWYGGGAGAYTDTYMGGGGGGSSYLGYSSVLSGFALAGSKSTQANSSDEYNDNAGKGGGASFGGISGKVVIITNPISVTIGGVPATSVKYVDSNTITAITPINTSGVKDIVVTNSDGVIATLEDSFTYTGSTIVGASPSMGSEAGGTQVTITGSNILGHLSSISYNFTGRDQHYVASENISRVKVKAWGGGGGGGVPSGWIYGFAGGGGGYSTATIPVSEYQNLAVMVGAGGYRGGISPTYNFYGGGGNNCTNGCEYSGQGGGRSAIRIGGEDILTAGGGGGGGSSRNSNMLQVGGGGGGLTGQDGLSLELPNARGRGGTQSAGGAAGTAGGGNGTAGSKYTGGNSFYSYGGSGGGGWYGGGAGSYQESNTMGGGGGGSSYIGYSSLINPSTIAASYQTQANASDTDNGGAGAGGAAVASGQPGKVVVYTQPIDVFFGSERATSIQVVDSNTIIATSPANTSGTKSITVVTPDGENHILADSFTFNPQPVISNISPNKVSYLGGTTVTITGSDFQDTPTVKFDDIDATSVNFINSTTLTATVPAHDSGFATVKIINPDGIEYSLVNGVEYTLPAPTITTITPSAGPTVGGNSVTISGENFLRKNYYSYATDGLVGYWPMNGDSGNTISDLSGNNLNGTATSLSATSGYLSNGRQFSTSGYVTVPHNSLLNPTTGITIQSWIKPAAFTDYRVIAGKMPWTSNYSYQISTTPTGAIRVDLSSNGTSYVYLVSQTTITAGQWSNVAFTWDGSTVKIFVNGVQDANTLSFAGPIFGNSNNFEIGRPAGGSAGVQQFFNGVIDEVMLYSRALTQGELEQNYKSANAITFRDGFQSHFKLDETTGQTITNSIPFGPTGFMGTDATETSEDPARLTGANCKFGGCLSFSGNTSPKYVNLPTNFNQVSTISFSLWFKTTGTNMGILGQSSTSPAQGTPSSFVPVLSILPDGKLRAELYTGATNNITTASAVNDGQWHHVVITGNSVTQNLYLDNTLVGSRAGALNFSWWNSTSLGTAYLDTTRGATINTWGYFNGAIDDVRIFSRYLEAADVNTIYNNNYPQVADNIDVFFDNRIASNINFVDSSTVTLVAPEGDGGPVDVRLINGDGQEKTAINGYRYIYDRFAIISPALEVRATEPGMMVVQAQDISGNPIILDSDVTLNLSSTSTSGFFAIDLNENESTRWDYSSVTITAGNSNATFYYKDNSKGTPTITADSGVPESLPATQQVDIKSKYQFIITGVTTPIKVGVPSSVTVISTDYNGTPQHDYTGTINFTSTDPATLLPANFTFDSSMLGEHTFVNGVTMVTQGEFCVTATDINDSDITGSQCNIMVTAPDEGTIAKLKILNGTQTIQLDGKTTEITVQAQDINGTGIPVLSITPLYFYTDSVTGEFSTDGVNWSAAPFTTNIPAYATSKNFFYRDSSLGAHNIVVRDDSVANSDGSGINVGWENDSATITTAVGSASKLALTGVPANLSSDTVSNAISISMQDIAGNNLTATQDKNVYLTSDNNSILFSTDGVNGFATSISTKILTGNLTAVVYVKSLVSGSTNIILSDAAPADGATGLIDDSKPINITAGVPAKIIVTSAPSEVVAGAASDVISVQLQDVNNNPSPASGNLTLYLSASSANAVFSATSFGTLTTTITIPNGTDSANFYFKQNQYFATQTITIADTIGGFGAGGITDVQTTINILTGSPASLDIVENSYNATAGVAAGPLTAILQNNFGVEIPTQSDIPLYFYTNSAGTLKEFSLLNSPWSAITTHTLTSGQSRFTFFYKDSKSGTSTITVSDDNNPAFEFGLTNATLPITVAAATPSSVKFSSTSQTAEAGLATGAITITLYDEFNNISNAPSNRVVNLSSSSATGRFDTASNGAFNGTITSVTFISGQNNKTFYYKDTTVGSPIITIASSGITGDTQTQTITNGNVVSYTLTTTSSTIVAGNVLDKLTLRTYNAGNVNIPVPSAFAINLQTNSTGGRFDTVSNGSFDGTVTSVIIPMNENYVDFYYRDTKAGTSTISATKATFTTRTQNIQVTAAAVSKIAFKDVSLAGLNIGQKSAAIYIQSQDQFGNTSNVTGNTTVYLHSSSANHEFFNISNAVINSIVIPTGSYEVPIYYKDYIVGTPTITLSDYTYPDSPDQGLTNATNTINITYGNPAKIDLVAQSLSLEVGTPSQITLKLLNQYDQEVPAITDTLVNLSSTNLSGEFDTLINGDFNLTSVTVPNGSSSITFYYRDTTSGSATVTASRAGLTSDTIIYNLTPTNVFSLVFNNAVQTITAGVSSTVYIIKFRDQYGNYTIADTDFTIDLSSAELSAEFALLNSGPWNITSVDVLTGAEDARFYYKDTVAGTKQLTVSGNALQSGSQNVTVTANAPTSMQFVPNIPQTVAGQLASGLITVVLYDTYSNVAKPSSTLTLNLASSSSQYEFSKTITPWTPVTSVDILNSESQSTFYYKDWIIGNSTITVADNANNLSDITLDFTIIASDAAKLLFTTTEQSTFVNTPTDDFEFYVADENGYQTQLNTDSEILVTSSSATGQFSIDNGQTWTNDITFNVLASTNTLRSFKYVDSEQGNPIITISSAGLTSATQTLTVTTGTISKIGIQGVNTISAGVPIALTIQTLNSSNIPVSVENSTVLTLDTTSGTGEFSLAEEPWTPITQVTLLQWQNQKTVYYRDTIAGAATITINALVDQGWEDGVKTIDTNSAAYNKIIFLAKPNTVVAEALSSQFVIQTVDQYGNFVDTDLRTVYIHSPVSGELSEDGISFAASPLTLNINDGESTAGFYYKDSQPGSKTITATDVNPLDNPDTGIVNAVANVSILGQTPVGVRVTSIEYTGANKVTAGQFTGAITIEAYKADNSPAILGNNLQVDLSTNPLSSGDFKLTADSQASDITTVNIPSGQTSVNVYFTTNTAGTFELNFDSASLTGATQNVEFEAAQASKFVFLTTPQTAGAGNESDQFRVSLQDEFNNIATYNSDLTLNLSTTGSGEFSVQNGLNWLSTNQITLTAGNSDIYFYYKDTVSGSYTLTVDEVPSQSITAATQTYIVASGSVAEIRFLSAANTLVVNEPSNAITVALYDIFGNPTIAETNTSVYLYSSSGQGQFAATNGFNTLITDGMINAGSSNFSFYYKDLNSNNALITVSDQATLDNPDIGIINATQTQVINWGNVAKLSFINTNSTVQAGSPKLLQLRLLNSFDGVVQTPDDVTIYLSSTSGTGQFALDNLFSSTLTEYTISENGNGVDLYYKDTTAASVTVTAADTLPATPDTNIVNAQQTFTVASQSLSNLVFITSAQNLTVGQVSNSMSVQARDIYGNITTVQNDTPLYLYSTSPTGKFSATTSFGESDLIFQKILTAGTSTVSFYYKDSTYVAPASNPIVKVSNQFPNPGVDDSITDATQMQTINAGNISAMEFDPSSNLGSIIAGVPSSALTVVFKNQYGIEIPLTTNKTLYLFSSLGGAQFAQWNGSSCSTFGITSLTVNTSSSRFSYCYKSTQSGSTTLTVSDTAVSTPDTAWTNATGTMTVDAGTISQIVFNNESQTIVARHPSAELKIETRNQYGNPTAVASNKTIFLRSSSSTGEFALSATGPWGVNFATISAGQNTVSVYYRDSTATTLTPVTITAADSLPLVPDTAWTNGTLAVNITLQTVQNFLVTNISDPQYQGNASSVVVIARDSENYVVDWYTGTISFTSSDAGALLPQSYTFTSADKGLKTFVNGIAFVQTGEQYVRVTDTNGVTGEQNNITVVSNIAGPATQVRFKDVANPLNVQKDNASVPITIQIRDSNGQPSLAGVGGFTVKLSSSSGTGQYSLSPNGPWSSDGVFTIPQNFNVVNAYYKDSTAGNFTLTASDWLGNADDSGISNDSISTVVNTLLIDVSSDLEVNNNIHTYIDSPIIYAKNDTGAYLAKADFQISTLDAITSTPKLSNITINWKSTSGAILQNSSVNNTVSTSFNVANITGTAQEGSYALEISATAADGSFSNTETINIPVSGWTAKIDYNPDNINIGQPIEFTIQTRLNGVLTNATDLVVNLKDNNGSDVVGSGYSKTLSQLNTTATGEYSGTLSSNGLSVVNPYYLYTKVLNNSAEIVAEDNNNDIFFDNNPAATVKNFIIEKELTSSAPATENYNLNFSWDSAQYALNYNLYRSTNRFTQLFQDNCSAQEIESGHRFGDIGSTEPFCDSIISQIINVDDTTSWVKMATINSPAISYTIPWSQVQSELTNGTYYFILRAENESGESAYSTMVYSTRRSYAFNASLANTNWISIPYESNYTKASDIVTEIEGGTGANTNQKINTVTLWRANSQDVESFKYNPLLNKWVGTDFSIVAGDGISLILSGNTSNFNWTVAGNDIVAQKAFALNLDKPNNNWLSIPHSTIFGTASEIVNNIEGGLNTNQRINGIYMWNAANQTSESFVYNSNLGIWEGNDFVINPGDGISIDLSGGTSNVIWTPYLIINPNK